MTQTTIDFFSLSDSQKIQTFEDIAAINKIGDPNIFDTIGNRSKQGRNYNRKVRLTQFGCS